MGNAKVPLRELANLFNHLPANSKAQLQSAFADAEDNLNFNNTANTGNQARRTLSSLVASPVLTATTNSRGFDVSWNRLDDKRISFYEVQVSFDSIFAAPDDYTVVDTSLALEGIGSTVYIRARGVRFDGQCGPWSDPITVDALATAAGPVVYSRGYDQLFYQTTTGTNVIQHLSITPERQNGGIVVFGSVGFGTFVGPGPGALVKVKLNSTVLDNIDLNTNPYTSSYVTDTITGDKNFSISYGPVFLEHSAFAFSTADDLHPSVEANSGSGSGTFTGWTFNLGGGLGVPDTTFPSVNYAKYSQTCTAIGETRKTKYLHMTGFGAAVPTGNTVTGIQVVMYGDIVPTHFDPTKSTTKIIEFGLIDDTSTRRATVTTGVAWPDSSSGSGAIPTITFGGASDLFGEAAGFWTPTKLNSANFGVYMRGQFHVASTDTAAASWIGAGSSVIADFYTYGLTMTIHSVDASGVARIDVLFVGTADILNCTINAIEFGEALTA